MNFDQSSTSTVIARQDRTVLKNGYQHWRSVSTGINNLLVQRLSKTELHAGAEKLGILKGGVLVFESEAECNCLMDYCIHHVRTDGRSAVERELIARSDEPESNELTYLRSLQHTTYSLFIVEAVEPGLGVHVRDLRSQAMLFVMDLGFGSSAVPGLLLATRIISLSGLNMTGGAAIPLGNLPDENDRSPIWQKLSNYLDSLEDDFDPAALIRECLSAGGGSRIQFQEVGRKPIGSEPIGSLTHSGKVGRNASCPCGSGKKFKYCCG